MIERVGHKVRITCNQFFKNNAIGELLGWSRWELYQYELLNDRTRGKDPKRRKAKKV